MTGAVVDRLRQAQPGDHFLWRVGSAGNHVDTASAVVAEARARGRRVLVFGPTDGPVLAALWASADAVVDPAASLMADGRVSPAPVLARVREEAEAARQDGFTGLYVWADMDWARATRGSVALFTALELLVDRELAALGVTAVCAYPSSFDDEMLDQLRCVHELDIGIEHSAPFRLTAGRSGPGWVLSGYVGADGRTAFAEGLDALLDQADCRIDLDALEAIDADALHLLAEKARRSFGTVTLTRVPPSVAAQWRAGGFDTLAPNVIVRSA